MVLSNSSDKFQLGTQQVPVQQTMFVITGVLTLFGLLVFEIITSRNPLQEIPKLKGFRATIIGVIYTCHTQGLFGLVDQLIAIGRDKISYAKIGGITIVSIQDPALTREVLALPPSIASREGQSGLMMLSPWRTFNRLLGATLFSATGPEVPSHRKVYVREFNTPDSLAQKFDTIFKTAQEHVGSLCSGESSCEIPDMKRVADNYSIAAWGDLLYGIPSYHADGHVWKISNEVIRNPGSIWTAVKNAVPVLMGLRSPHSLSSAEAQIQREVKGIVERSIAYTNESKGNQDAAPVLIRRLSMASGGGQNGTLSELAYQLASLNVFGGNGYTGAPIALLMLELAKKPDQLRILLDEIDSKSTFDYLTIASGMPYLEAVVTEAIRLYPAVFALVRVVNSEVTLNSHSSPVTLSPGTLVISSIIHMQRSEKHWGSDAADFNPERFLDGRQKGNRAYMAFGIGPRNCPGNRMGVLLIKTYLTVLLRSYHVELANSDHEITLENGIIETTKPVAVRLTKRPHHGIGGILA